MPPFYQLRYQETNGHQGVEFCREDIVEAEQTPAEGTDNKNENYAIEEGSADIATYNSDYESGTNSVDADGVDLEAGSDETTVSGREQSKPPDAVETDHNIGTMVDGACANVRTMTIPACNCV